MPLNQVILHGNLTRDPETRYTPKGLAVAKIGIAINRKWKTESGETKEEVTFVDVDCFGRTAETVGKYFTKGKQIIVIGRLKLDQWDDKATGKPRSKLGVVMESFSFCGEKWEGHDAPAPRKVLVEGDPEPVDDSGDVPF